MRPGARVAVSQQRGLLFGWSLALLAMAAFAALGAWQYGRMHEKQALLDAAARVLRDRRPQPLALASDPARAKAYDWAAGEGRFADAPAVLLDNQSRQERAGVRAYRLFLPDGAPPLLVELGWLPLPGDRRMPGVAAIAGRRRVSGLLLAPPSHGLAAPVAVRQGGGTVLATGLQAPALPGLLGQARLAPRILRLDPALPLGYARDLDVLPNTLPPQRHLGYAVQWLALALAVLVTALILTFRRPKPSP